MHILSRPVHESKTSVTLSWQAALMSTPAPQLQSPDRTPMSQDPSRHQIANFPALAVPPTGVLVLAATNRPFAIDAALMRPGRFDAVLYVPPPDAAGRAQILRVHTRGMPLAADVDLDLLSCDATECMTGGREGCSDD